MPFTHKNAKGRLQHSLANDKQEFGHVDQWNTFLTVFGLDRADVPGESNNHAFCTNL